MLTWLVFFLCLIICLNAPGGSDSESAAHLLSCLNISRAQAELPPGPAPASAPSPARHGGISVGRFTYSTLPEAVQAAGQTPATLWIQAGSYHLARNLTIPANLHLRLDRGAILQIADQVTLTLNGTLEAGPYQIFQRTGSGKVAFGKGSVKEMLIRWWGAKGDAATDDTAAFQAALEALEAGNFTLSACSGDKYLVNTVTFNSWAYHWKVCLNGNGAWLIQKDYQDVLVIKSRSKQFTLRDWVIKGSCEYVWYHPGLAAKPAVVSFNGVKGTEAASKKACNGKNKWYWEAATQRLYIYAFPAGTKKFPDPDDVYQENIQADGVARRGWTRYFGEGAGIKAENSGAIYIQGCGIRNVHRAVYAHGSCFVRLMECEGFGGYYFFYGDFHTKGKMQSNVCSLEHCIINQYWAKDGVIYFTDSYGLQIRDCTMEGNPHSLITLKKGHNATIEGLTMELNFHGQRDNPTAGSAITIDNFKGVLFQGNNFGCIKPHGINGFIEIIRGSSGINFLGNTWYIQNSTNPATKPYAFKTDGTAHGINFMGNELGVNFKSCRDYLPCATWTNNTFQDGSWIVLPATQVQRVEGKGAQEYCNNPGFTRRWASDSDINEEKCRAVIDQQVGYDDNCSWKITWQGPGAWAKYLHLFDYPASGTHTGVVTLFIKSDTDQVIDLIVPNFAGLSDVPLKGDGRWYCISGVPYTKDFSGVDNIHSLQVNAKSASKGNIWIDRVSMRYFASRQEADAFVGCVDISGKMDGGVLPKPDGYGGVNVVARSPDTKLYRTGNTSTQYISQLIGGWEGRELFLALGDPFTTVQKWRMPPSYLYTYAATGGWSQNYHLSDKFDFFRDEAADHDAIYWGYRDTRYGGVRTTVGTPCTLKASFNWEYWNGAAWQPLTVNLAAPFKNPAGSSNEVLFQPPADWAVVRLSQAGVAGAAPDTGHAYWIRCRLSGVGSGAKGGAAAGGPNRLMFLDLKGDFGPLPQAGDRGVLPLLYSGGIWHEIDRKNPTRPAP